MRIFERCQHQRHADTVVGTERRAFGLQPAITNDRHNRIARKVVRLVGIVLANHVEVRLQDNARRALMPAAGRLADDQVARRIEFPDGRFAGMIVANLGMKESFEGFYESMAHQKDMFITLRNVNNQILVRYPVVEEKQGTVLSGSAASKIVLDGAEEKVIVSISPIDQIERIVALRKLTSYPVYASVGLSKDIVFQAWKDELFTTVLVMLALAYAGWVGCEYKPQAGTEAGLGWFNGAR